MLEFEELNQRLSQSQKPIDDLKEALNIDNLKTEIAELEKSAPLPIFGTIWKKAKRLCKNRFVKSKG